MKDEPFEISSSSTFRTFTEEGDLESAASRQLRAIPCTWDNIYRTEKIEYLQDKVKPNQPKDQYACLQGPPSSKLVKIQSHLVTILQAFEHIWE